jgi:tRNA(fMet)-specific endonuclease VapC
LILADSDVLIDFLAGVQPAAERVAGYVEANRLQTTAITCFELLSGAGEGKRGNAIRALLDVLPVLPFDRQAAVYAAGVRRQLEQTGQPIGMADSLIAGIALAQDAALYTRNLRHFERVPGLRLL